ncbi:EamA-like transporter family protein [Devosia lucknowensis]|uniref:EamA-like transporter family protein n=1 Tax=Devosia lucknowensis TaxID=1096929 RepID=A0A1Y6FQI1_9HYPH|nr:aromatic amino acid DMT transporter YddG [Devosia lucknowensis]SMQ75731.1 EamA-like transporter family protein [Devosia lucknowensis]
MPISPTSASLRATGIGLVAVLLWASVVGLIKSVSTSFGATGGAALLYTLATVCLMLSVGLGDVRRFPRRYLLIGGLLFVSYELCLSLSIGYSTTSRQAIEVGMVNYLWPTFTLVGTILFHRRKTSPLIVPGVLLSMTGIVWVLGGDQGFDLFGMTENVLRNPLSYGLAFVGAIIWAAYCVVTPKLSGGLNGVTLFFGLTACALWIKLAFSRDIAWTSEPAALFTLLLAAAAMGFAYAAWNVGILRGNPTALATASYFTPVLSAAFAALVLPSTLPLSFWQGTAMVCLGSIVCWFATRQRPSHRLSI